MSFSHCSLPKLTLTLVAVIFVIGGCQRQNENILSEEEASQLLDRYMETINNVDMDLIDEIISPDYVLRSPMFPRADSRNRRIQSHGHQHRGHLS